jgi:hypothetical protein
VDSLAFSPDAREQIRAAGATFGEEATLAFEGLERAPNGPGVFVLVIRDPGAAPYFAWSEASHDVRARLRELTSRPELLQGELRALLTRPERLRFRAAAVADSERRNGLAASLTAEVRRTRPQPIVGFVC